MWSRVQLKDKAKYALDKNYWKIILVSLIVAIVGGGTVTGATNTFEFDLSSLTGGMQSQGNIPFGNDFSMDMMGGLALGGIAGILGMVFLILPIVIALGTAIGFAYSAFITNPVIVGTNRFFFLSLNQKAEVKEIAFAIDNNYKNVVKILFIRDIKIFLWSLLFVIPGIVKSYEYLMMPYLLAENPDLTQEEAFRLSKQMMTGNKFEAWILDLSFLGWDILSAMTAGIVGIFYVEPYRHLTHAALYEELSAINGYPARAAAAQSYAGNPYEPAGERGPEFGEDEI